MISTPYNTIKQAGFTLFELMIAIEVIAILTAIGLPSYQGYVQKAIMTDMLQTMTPYKIAIEICVLQQGSLAEYNNGSNDIPITKTTHYVISVNVTLSVISLIGQGALTGLTTTLTPVINKSDGNLNWSRVCKTAPTNKSMTDACNDVFRF